VLGERIFPGGSQLAVLLSIREANIEPLREARSRLPEGLFEVLETALAREPLRRYQDAAAFAAALQPFERGTAVPLETALSAYVARAADHAELAKRIEGRVRDSVRRMQAARPEPESDEDPATTPPPRPSRSFSLVRRASGQQLGAMTFAQLVEMIATGELDGRDEVALMGASEFRRIEDVEELSRHLLPSTTKKTGQLFEPGVPDYAADLAVTPMMRVLAYLRERRETGALFVEQHMPKRPPSRKELYLSAGRLVHVVSSDPQELFGRYLVRRGKLTAEQLEQALDTLDSYGGRLGDTLVGLGFVDVVDVFQAIRDQGRDRVGQLCAWSVGRAAFYRGAGPGAVQFPLDLDLSSAMMSGAILANDRRPERALPDGAARVVPGPRAAEARDLRERGTAPSSLQSIPDLAATQPTLSELIHLLTTGREEPNARVIGTREAHAALVVAQTLGWVDFVSEG
jgi:serine/threonine-protein kinase